ncbi:MAG TPA: nuclear transport factor 2 family protein [Solirubrobacteraceae bacterium]|nr:nuclear transport factor 2 family protein [Solirubrobacteraceae bacterium]
MAERSTTPDLVELSRRQFAAGNRHDADAVLSNYVPDAVWDLSDAGMGVFEGVAAIRAFFEEWWGTWGDHVIEVEEVVDLGHGVMFSSVREDGRLAGSDGHVEQRRGWITMWAQDKIERVTVYLDVDKARAVAGRLAEDRRR